jgi:VanZ family protein
MSNNPVIVRKKIARTPPLSRALIALWVIAVIAVITVSLMSAKTLHRMHADTLFANDKIGHFSAYVILAVLPVVAVELLGLGVFLASAMIPLGVVLEFAQRHIPGRSFDTHDMLANSLGVLSGVLIAVMLRQFLRSPAPSRSR